MARPSPFTCGALFAGIGGFCFGFEKLGFKTRWALDMNEEAVETYKVNFPKTETICADISEVNKSEKLLPKVDVLHAGFPCQSFSAAGNREGFEDERGKVLFEIIKLIENLGKDKPAVLVLENSNNFKGGERGDWFDTLRNEMQRLDYWFEETHAVTLDTRTHAGLPQRRERLFMVATSMDHIGYNHFPGSEIIKENELIELRGLLNLGEVKDEEYFLSEENAYGGRIMKKAREQNGDLRLLQLRRMEIRVQEPGVCPTLTANMGTGGHNVPFVVDDDKLRKLTETECLRLQGFEDSFKWPPHLPLASKYRLIGNSVSPMVSCLVAQPILQMLRESKNVQH